MAKIIMGIGVPGSGKTTVLKPFAKKNAYSYISSDDIRVELTGDAADQSKKREVWQEVRNRVVESLKKGKTIVLDATFANKFERKSFIKFAREHGAQKVLGVFVSISYEIASERNQARERVVPKYAIQRMYQMLQKNPPVVEDGFDGVFDINELQELDTQK